MYVHESTHTHTHTHSLLSTDITSIDAQLQAFSMYLKQIHAE